MDHLNKTCLLNETGMTTDYSEFNQQLICDYYLNNNVSNTTDSTSLNSTFIHENNPYVAPIIVITFGIITLLGFVGNTLVLMVVWSNNHMRNSTNILISSLALADLMFILICVPFTTVQLISSQWPFGNIFCKISQYSNYTTAYGSVYTLVLMSVDRYLAVVHPTRSNLRSSRNTWIALSVMWIIILTANAPMYLWHGTKEYKYDNTMFVSCVFLKIYDEQVEGITTTGRIFTVIFFVCAYALPLTVSCVLYGKMLYRLFHGQSMVRGQSTGNHRRRRATRMVIVVVVVFALCWAPMHIRFFVIYFKEYPESSLFIFFHYFSCGVAYLNSCVNPILYNCLSEMFRRGFKRLLRCNKVSEQEMSVAQRARRPCEQATTRNPYIPMTCVTDVQHTQRSKGDVSPAVEIHANNIGKDITLPVEVHENNIITE